MIERLFFYILLAILLSDIYIDRCFLRSNRKYNNILRVALWLCGAFMAAFTVWMNFSGDFAPDDTSLVNTYLFLLGFLVLPLFLSALLTAVGQLLSRLLRLKRNYGIHLAVFMTVFCWFVLVYGSTFGNSELAVRNVECEFPSLPDAFDGYRIVHISDLHVGTYDGEAGRERLVAAMDTVMAQKPDMIVFTGDLQNRFPDEIRRHVAELALLKAPDGVYSVLGNHDYAEYCGAAESEKDSICSEIVANERAAGWTLLLNESRTVRRGADSIVVAGMENAGHGGRSLNRGDIGRTLAGISDSSFVVMLQHDPRGWRNAILPESNAALTLSGHTHAMQFALFGWSPASLVYREWGGIYKEGDRVLNVSTGVGGFVPFRFGVPGEIVVVTLKKPSRNKTD